MRERTLMIRTLDTPGTLPDTPALQIEDVSDEGFKSFPDILSVYVEKLRGIVMTSGRSWECLT